MQRPLSSISAFQRSLDGRVPQDARADYLESNSVQRNMGLWKPSITLQGYPRVLQRRPRFGFHGCPKVFSPPPR